MKVMVSACLAGVKCRYDGGAAADPLWVERVRRGEAVPLCPELLGGLALPRPPSEIVGGGGRDVAAGRAPVLTREGLDVTKAFLTGARRVVEIALQNGITRAYLKDKSPSCGVCQIFDGSFSGRLIPGCGVTAALLTAAGIAVFPGDRKERKP
ncbi:DUF523 domain-containing protein [Gehongia tenuis]|uniref:DUF523 domain-containing protein n=1 Tax=Gehongia tenuis TaxID=2763655 RepID=A0A926HPX1_9FIRM|nr:DUF523 domain-containing protein [Gehongia tenuis]MBC8530646.1 DUF523 domain-containing protein [Gehongia tenuis]